MDCAAIGDNVAAAIATPLTCEVRASSGLDTSRIIDIASGAYHKYCIISAGNFDPIDPQYQKIQMIRNLYSIRTQSECKFYVWILPQNSVTAKFVNQFAVANHDIVVQYSTNLNTIIGNITGLTGN